MLFEPHFCLYDSSFHKQKSAIYAYKASTYLNNFVNNITQIIFTPRFIGLTSCALIFVAASFIPFLHTPILGYLASYTLTLINNDPAFMCIGALFNANQTYSVLDKAKFLCTTIMLMDNGLWGINIAKSFVKNIVNGCAYTSYQLLSWSEYFKALVSDFCHINKENNDILDIIPEKLLIKTDRTDQVIMHQQALFEQISAFTNDSKILSKEIISLSTQLLGIIAIMNSVTLVDSLITPTNIIIPQNMMELFRVHVLDTANSIGSPYNLSSLVLSAYSGWGPLKMIGLMASIAPLFASDYVQTYCNGNIFSLNSLNYHIAQYAAKDIHNQFVDTLGTSVILTFLHSALIIYHSTALCKAWYSQEQSQAEDNLPNEEVLGKLQEDIVYSLETQNVQEEIAQLIGEISN